MAKTPHIEAAEKLKKIIEKYQDDYECVKGEVEDDLLPSIMMAFCLKKSDFTIKD